MLFNSLIYVFFLSAVAIVIYFVPIKYQWLWLLAGSIFFYYKLLPAYLILFFALIVMNYFLGIAIEKAGEKRKTIFIWSVIANAAILVFFKYFGFFETLISGIKELSSSDQLLKIFLPVGLSFFIFTILGYLIELKRGTISAERHIGVFASALLFFPKIMQGPIERPGKLFHQFSEAKSFDYGRIVEGLKLMLWGYFKKLVVADRLAIYVNAVYGNWDQHSGVTLLFATIFYSFQIYADFSGYTDIALGSAKVLGINLTNNFMRPYFATSVKDFWNRWHISFSYWLRDYIFLPLAILFAGRMKESKYLGIAAEKWIFLFSLAITFAICGIWHGEGLNFLIWGLLFSIYLTIANWTFGFRKRFRSRFQISKRSEGYKIFGIVTTFILVSFAWIFFRAENTLDAFQIMKKVLLFKGELFIDYPTFFYGFLGLGFLLLIEYLQERKQSGILPFKTNHWIKEQFVYAGLVALIILIGVFDGGQFIYFKF